MSDDTKSDDTTRVTLNTRTMLLVASLLGGGVLGGGGVSIATGPSKEDFDDLKEDVASLKSSVESVALAAVEIKAELRSSRQADQRHDSELQDHEVRIRALEHR